MIINDGGAEGHPTRPLLRPRAGGNPDYWHHRETGLKHLEGGRIDDAVRSFSLAARLEPALPEALWNLGKALQQARRYEAARRVYTGLISLERKSEAVAAALESLPPAPPERPDFIPGQILRSLTTNTAWEIERVLKGGYGTVCVVRDQNDGLLYALKTLQAHYLWSDEDRRRFLREAATWVSLGLHPHVVSAHWIERIEGFLFIVLEYVEGDNLAAALSRGHFGLTQAIDLGLQFCDGMAYAHRTLKIVHRDIKPANCMLTRSGTLKITDFGLARPTESALENVDLDLVIRTFSGDSTTPLGTDRYRAPEQQCGAGIPLSFQTDVYAFGIVLFEALTGDKPEIGYAAKECMTGSPGARNLPKELFTLLLSCVEHDVALRPSNFMVVRKALEDIYRRHTGRGAATLAVIPAMTMRDWQNKAAAFQMLEFFDKALECYDRALSLRPRNSSLLKGKAGTLLGLQQYQQAFECCERGLQSAPDDSGLWNNRGLAMLRLGHKEGALSCFDTALRRAPGDGLIWRNRGETLYLLGRSTEALASYDRALSIDKNDTGTLELKGFALLSLDRFQEALDAFNQGITVAPRQPGLWKGSGIALHNLDRYSDAILSYARAIEADPSDFELYRYEAQALNSAGDPKPAVIASERGLSLKPGDSELWKAKGVALFLLGETERALETFLTGHQLAPKDSEFYKNIGGALIECGQFREAISWLNRGLELAPDDPYLWRNKGVALYRLGEHAQALTCFDRGLQLFPEDPTLREGRELASHALRESRAKTAPTVYLGIGTDPRPR
jgi:tetratricopeptide (TPR) repeat protein